MNTEEDYRLLKEMCDDLHMTFELRHKADMRAIERWCAEHPGKELVMPDHADLVVWLIGRISELEQQLAQAQAAAAVSMQAGLDAVKNQGWLSPKESAKLQAQIAQKEQIIKHACEDAADDDTRIRDLCKPYLTDFELNGDSYGVPGITDVVETTLKKLERYEKALKESAELMFKHMQFAHQSDRQATETEWEMMALISKFDEQFKLGIRQREALKEGKAL